MIIYIYLYLYYGIILYVKTIQLSCGYAPRASSHLLSSHSFPAVLVAVCDPPHQVTPLLLYFVPYPCVSIS